MSLNKEKLYYEINRDWNSRQTEIEGAKYMYELNIMPQLHDFFVYACYNEDYYNVNIAKNVNDVNEDLITNLSTIAAIIPGASSYAVAIKSLYNIFNVFKDYENAKKAQGHFRAWRDTYFTNFNNVNNFPITLLNACYYNIQRPASVLPDISLNTEALKRYCLRLKICEIITSLLFNLIATTICVDNYEKFIEISRTLPHPLTKKYLKIGGDEDITTPPPQKKSGGAAVAGLGLLGYLLLK